MGMYGDRDIVVDPNSGSRCRQGLPGARIERFPRVRPFYHAG